MDRKVYSTI